MARKQTKKRPPARKLKKPFPLRIVLAVILLGVLLYFGSDFLVEKKIKPLNRKEIEGTPVSVVDGDTVSIADARSGRTFTCRLYGIDAPEMPRKGRQGQPFAKEAQEKLQALLGKAPLRIDLTGSRTDSKEICLIRKDGMDVNQEMAISGLAWAYRQYLTGPYASRYVSAERRARQKARGLWSQENPEPPWEFRNRLAPLPAVEGK